MMTAPFTEAAGMPVSEPTPVKTYSPVVLPVPGRPVDLHLKVSAPATGTGLPVILLSHGHGPSNFVSSLHGYGPLADFWAAHGFAVIQPTHLDSMTLGLREAEDPDAPLYARTRAQDMQHILDHLDEIEAAAGLTGTLDRTRIAVVGHSLGGLTAGLLAGATIADSDDGARRDYADDRVKAAVLLAAPGRGEDLNGFLAGTYPILGTTSYATMTKPALIVAGENDWNAAFSDRKDWRSDAYELSPGPKTRLLLFGAEHALGGISSYDAAETTDENPERVAFLRAMIWAYLRSALDPGDAAWGEATAALENMPNPLGAVEAK